MKLTLTLTDTRTPLAAAFARTFGSETWASEDGTYAYAKVEAEGSRKVLAALLDSLVEDLDPTPVDEADSETDR